MEFVMSRKNRQNRDASSDRHLHVVADDPGQTARTTEDKVRAALVDSPGSTTVKLAMTAGVGRSTAAKILARWGRDGDAIRTAGGGPRDPDTWALALSDSDAADTAMLDADDTLPDALTTPNTDQVSDTVAEEPAGTEETANDVAESAAEGLTGGACSSSIDADGHTAPSPAASAAVADSTDTGPRDKNRLPKGGLRVLVKEYLAERPDGSFDLLRSARSCCGRAARSTTRWRSSSPTDTRSRPARRRSGSPSTRTRLVPWKRPPTQSNRPGH